MLHPVGDFAVVDKWIKTISDKATTSEGKLYASQLASVVTFYNKVPETLEQPQVNWEDWSKRITTKGLVEKIRDNTQALINQKYNVTAIAEKLGGEKSDDYKRIVGIIHS